MRSIFTTAGFALALTAFASLAQAHVTMRPPEAAPGATTTYTVRVPSEGEAATTSVELEIPDGVTVVSVAGAADSYTVKKNGDRITAVTWKTSIPAGERGELTFAAKNPAAGTEIAWKAHQFFSDGTRADWVEPKGGKRPGPVTTLKAP